LCCPTFGGATQPHLLFAGLGKATVERNLPCNPPCRLPPAPPSMKMGGPVTPNPSSPLRINSVRSLMSRLCRGCSMKSARGLSRRLRFLAAFGWCRNDTVEPLRVGICIFQGMTPVKCVLQTYLGLPTLIRSDDQESWTRSCLEQLDHEFQGCLDEFVRFFHLRGVAAVVYDYQVGTRDGFLVQMAALQWHQVVMAAPNDAGGYVDALQ